MKAHSDMFRVRCLHLFPSNHDPFVGRCESTSTSVADAKGITLHPETHAEPIKVTFLPCIHSPEYEKSNNPSDQIALTIQECPTTFQLSLQSSNVAERIHEK